MDDGTAGEMVASRNYWKVMSTAANENNLNRPDESPSSNPNTSRDITSSEKEGPGDNNGGDGGGGGGGGMFGTSSTLGGVEWTSNHLESGNVKLDASASAVEASFVLSEETAVRSFR